MCNSFFGFDVLQLFLDSLNLVDETWQNGNLGIELLLCFAHLGLKAFDLFFLAPEVELLLAQRFFQVCSPLGGRE